MILALLCWHWAALVEEGAVIMATIVISIRLFSAAEAAEEETTATPAAATQICTEVIARLFVMRESRNRNNKQQQRLHVVVGAKSYNETIGRRERDRKREGRA